MNYTVWRKLNSTTYKFYMATKVAAAITADQLPSDHIITKTPSSFPYNYIHIDDLNQLPQIKL